MIFEIPIDNVETGALRGGGEHERHRCETVCPDSTYGAAQAEASITPQAMPVQGETP